MSGGEGLFEDMPAAGGQRGVSARFARQWERGAIADAYLFIGPSRRRLRSLAEECAAIVLGAAGDSAGHPDFVLFDPAVFSVRGLKVEHIARRKEDVPSLEQALQYRPAAGDRRVVLLLDADRMNADAQAALLKTAEEPPPGTLIFLTAADLGPLLPALRSRCRTWRVGPPPRAELAGLAGEAGLDARQQTVLEAALGSLEAALDRSPEERETLLARWASFQAWRRGEGPAAAWLEGPGGSLAEQREGAGLLLAAGLGWAREALCGAPPEAARRMDRLAGLLAGGLADLGHQVSPALVLEDLARTLDRPQAIA